MTISSPKFILTFQGQDLFVTDRSTNNVQLLQWKGMGRNPSVGHMKQKDMPENATDSSYCNLSLFIFGLFNNVASSSGAVNNELKGYFRNYTSFYLQRLRKTLNTLVTL
jgi:hypothetical protein